MRFYHDKADAINDLTCAFVIANICSLPPATTQSVRPPVTLAHSSFVRLMVGFSFGLRRM